jgi:hypothetical protein
MNLIFETAEDDTKVCTRVILDDFPRSQQRPVLLQYGPRIPLT